MPAGHYLALEPGQLLSPSRSREAHTAIRAGDDLLLPPSPAGRIEQMHRPKELEI
jgi:hypothetical protein